MSLGSPATWWLKPFRFAPRAAAKGLGFVQSFAKAVVEQGAVPVLAHVDSGGCSRSERTIVRAHIRRGPGEGPDCYCLKVIKYVGPISAQIRGVILFQFSLGNPLRSLFFKFKSIVDFVPPWSSGSETTVVTAH